MKGTKRMYAQTLSTRSSEHAKALRKRGGAYLKKLRNNADLTQRELANLLDLKYYTFISQIESGAGRLPPDMYEAAAKAFGVDLQKFTQKMLMYYDPFTYKALFGVPTKKDLDE